MSSRIVLCGVGKIILLQALTTMWQSLSKKRKTRVTGPPNVAVLDQITMNVSRLSAKPPSGRLIHGLYLRSA